MASSLNLTCARSYLDGMATNFLQSARDQQKKVVSVCVGRCDPELSHVGLQPGARVAGGEC